MSVYGAHEQRISGDCYSTIDAAATGPRVGRRRICILPKDPPRGCIQRDDGVRSLYGVHDSIHHQRSRLELFERPDLIDPLELQIFHIGGSDLVEQAIALAEGGARVS